MKLLFCYSTRLLRDPNGISDRTYSWSLGLHFMEAVLPHLLRSEPPRFHRLSLLPREPQILNEQRTDRRSTGSFWKNLHGQYRKARSHVPGMTEDPPASTAWRKFSEFQSVKMCSDYGVGGAAKAGFKRRWHERPFKEHGVGCSQPRMAADSSHFPASVFKRCTSGIWHQCYHTICVSIVLALNPGNSRSVLSQKRLRYSIQKGHD